MSEDLDLDSGRAHEEPELAPEAFRPYEEEALAGRARLRTDGFFISVAQVPVTPVAPRPLVLVVEDDPGTSGTIEAILRKQGFETRLAANLQGILRAVNARPRPDAVLLDVLLPDANGFAILERLKRHPELGRAPVVMLTSLSEPADVAKGLALGAAGYLCKPARPRVLVEALREVLGLAPAG